MSFLYNNIDPEIFTLSIEDTEGHSFQHGFHLGTIESIARQCAEDIYYSRLTNGLPVVTVALKLKGKIFDVFYGKCWNSNYPR